jgi:hypothetical protein
LEVLKKRKADATAKVSGKNPKVTEKKGAMPAKVSGSRASAGLKRSSGADILPVKSVKLRKGLKKDLEGARTARDVAVKDKELVQQAEQAKLQQFQDSICKKLAKLPHETEATVATLGGRSAKFPAGASLSDFFKWFRKEIESMPTAFVKCSENITSYALVGVFQMLAREG